LNFRFIIILFIYLFFQIDATKKTFVVSRSYEVPLFTFMLIHWSFWTFTRSRNQNWNVCEQNSQYSSMCHPILCTIVWNYETTL